jgi:hypothetical protein
MREVPKTGHGYSYLSYYSICKTRVVWTYCSLHTFTYTSHNATSPGMELLILVPWRSHTWRVNNLFPFNILSRKNVSGKQLAGSYSDGLLKQVQPLSDFVIHGSDVFVIAWKHQFWRCFSISCISHVNFGSLARPSTCTCRR